ncbi:hypothetical protein F4861DRAFT_534321 [Xylaria intraflava]|nr:hypothetical protein F4861DRAFT_534321 [Xylaria intraflava]
MTRPGSPALVPDSRSPLTAQDGADRRRIRKGTRSCWECKRRKSKCTWSRSEGSCDGCYHRGTRCIGQEFPDIEPAPHKKRGTDQWDDARLRRVETVLEELTRRVNPGNPRKRRVGAVPDDGDDELQVLIGSGQDPTAAAISPEKSAMNGIADQIFSVLSNDVLDDGRVTVRSKSSLPKAPAGSSLGQFGEATDKLIPLIRALVTVWPSKHHDAILSSNAGSLHPALAIACASFGNSPSPKDLLQLPVPGTAPDVIARKLLTLSTYLQVISSQSKSEIDDLSCDYRHAISRAFETVNKLITHNDHLPISVGTIECLIIESQYYNYMGNIRRACITSRRAIAMAQMMGLDRRRESLPLNTDPDTDEIQVSLRQENALFQLVHLDQYLSFILGIAPGLPQNVQTPPRLLERCQPWERMGRLHAMAAGRILQRNRTDIYDVIETREIDGILQKAEECVPAQWWLPTPDLSSKDCGEGEFSDPTSQLMVHFAHYNILLQLHLPYMLRSLTSQQNYYYSTTAVINSSREMLTRFTTFRRCHPSVSYCRGLDFFAFVASIALCLLHIHSSDENQVSNGYNGGGVSDLLAHQRPGSRGLMEQALESIEKISQVESNNNNIALDIFPVFRKLLAIEEEAHGGVSYDIRLSADSGQPMNSSYQAADSDVLYLRLPFYGTVEVKRRGVSNYIAMETLGAGYTTQTDPLDFTHPPATTRSVAAHSTQVALDDHQPIITQSHSFGEQQPTNPGTHPVPALLPDQQVPYSNNNAQASASVPGLLSPDIMDSFEELSDIAIDVGYFDCFQDMLPR